MADNKQLDKKLFTLRENDFKDVEVIAGESISFWKDARRRLRKNKIAMASLIVIIIMIFMAIFGPYMNEYNYETRVFEDKSKTVSTKIPPRIPGLELIGIADGTIKKEISVKSYDKLTEEELESYEYVKTKMRSGDEYVVVKEDVYATKDIKDSYFWFGTDDLGRDLWTRVWYGTRISLYIGFLAAFLDLTLGVVYGGIAGFNGGTRIDTLMMRFTEVVGGIPSLVILSIFLMIMDPGLLSISLAIGLTGWMSAARIIRAQFLKLKDREFVLASRTLGASAPRLIFKHLFPNIIGQLVIMVTFSIPAAIFYEAFLAFIGLGLPAPMPSIGRLCNDGYQFMKSYPYMLFIPSAFICVLMLCINLFSNGLRDALDPKMR